MAGSYSHATDDRGRLRNPRNIGIATETPGDTYETLEEFYGMVWWLAGGDRSRVEEARLWWLEGVELSPGVQPDDVDESDDGS